MAARNIILNSAFAFQAQGRQIFFQLEPLE